MATPKSTTPTLKAPVGMRTLPTGADVAFFEAGVGAYKAFRLNSEVEVKTDDGTVYKATVRGTQVAPLIDLVTSYGTRYVATYGQAYTPSNLIQSLTEQNGGEVLDVTELYTAVVVAIQMAPMPTPGSLSPTA